MDEVGLEVLLCVLCGVYFASFAVKAFSVIKLTAYPTPNVTTVPIATYQVHGTS